MNSNEQNTFDELIEAMWAGELDDAGKARIEALAAAETALGERLRRERAVSAMLAGHGPNRAPEGLAKAVFARLDLDAPRRAAKPRTELARVIPRSIWFTPAFRWGLAAAALLVVFMQVTWLLNRDRMGGGTIATMQTVPLKAPNAMATKGNLARYTAPKPNEIKMAATTGSTQQRPAAPRDGSKIAAVVTPKSTPTATSTHRPEEKMAGKAGPRATPTGTLAPKPNPNGASQTPQPGQTLVLHMVIPTEPERIETPAPAQRSTSVATQRAPVRTTPPATENHGPTARQIMRAITDAGGTVKGSQSIRTNPQALRVEGSIPRASMADFVERLGKMGIKPARGETVLPYRFKIVQGESLLHETETTTTIRPAATPANKQAAPIPLTVLIEETPLKK